MSSLEKVVRDIRGFKVQGANQIAVYGLEFLREYAKKEGFKLKFETAAYFLEEARPTAVVLHNCIEVLKRRRSVSTIDSLIKQIKAAGHRESAYADRIVKPGSRIMTYCHSGEAMSFIRHVWGKHRKSISVIACRTEPLEQGVKTAKELAALKIPVTLIDDNAADFFMKDVDMVVVGADALREEGFVNKIGTAMLAKSAKSRGKPFYVVANTLKVDRRRKLKIEERPAGEIYSKITNNRNMRRVKIRNPAFDVTPWKYVTAVVTEKGVMKPPALVRRFL